MKTLFRLIFSILSFFGVRDRPTGAVQPTRTSQSKAQPKAQRLTVPARRCDRYCKNTNSHWLKTSLTSLTAR